MWMNWMWLANTDRQTNNNKKQNDEFVRCVDGQKTILMRSGGRSSNVINWIAIILVYTRLYKKVSWHAPVVSNLMEKCTTLTNSYPVFRAREKLDKSLFISLRSPLHPLEHARLPLLLCLRSLFFSHIILIPLFFLKFSVLCILNWLTNQLCSKDQKIVKPYHTSRMTRQTNCCAAEWDKKTTSSHPRPLVLQHIKTSPGAIHLMPSMVNLEWLIQSITCTIWNIAS